MKDRPSQSRIRACLGEYAPSPQRQATGLEPRPLCDFCGAEALVRIAEHDFGLFTLRCGECHAHHLIHHANKEDTDGNT